MRSPANFRWRLLLLAAVALMGCRKAASQPAPTALSAEEARAILNQGLDHFYNLEFDQAIRLFERLRSDDASNAAWQNHVAVAYLYKELFQAGALEGDLFDSSNRFFRSKKFPKDPELERRFQEANRRAIELCERRLKENARDEPALYSCGVAYGLRASHQGLIERSAFSFLGNARKANDYHTQLVRYNPRHYDGYLIPGLYDFVLGSLPGPIKVLFFFAGLHGDKQRGIEMVENVARWGSGARYDALILLTVMYRREKRFADARRSLQQLAETFPRNYIFPLEIASLHRAAGELPEAIRAYERVLREIDAGSPNFRSAPAARIHFELGVLYQRLDDRESARRHFEQVPGARGTTPELNKESAANLARLRAGSSP
ncbi:MAG TPA: tetratricopeptide repeat protein [Terriglobia bacterium]|nr:tetratricopeptide repeat protein [Terriglobia bacterium]